MISSPQGGTWGGGLGETAAESISSAVFDCLSPLDDLKNLPNNPDVNNPPAITSTKLKPSKPIRLKRISLPPDPRFSSFEFFAIDRK
jgi:hypothetical protein